MTAERLFLNNEIKEAIRSQKKTVKRRKRPDELLCDMLNRLTSQQRQAVAERLR